MLDLLESHAWLTNDVYFGRRKKNIPLQAKRINKFMYKADHLGAVSMATHTE